MKRICNVPGYKRKLPLRMSIMPLYLFVALALIACAQGTRNKGSETVAEGKTLSLKYAEGFTLTEFDGYKRLTVRDPRTEGGKHACYYLVEDEGQETPADGLRIRIPLRSLASASVTHVAFLDSLGELESLKGFCSPGLLYNAELRKRWEAGRMVDLGDPFRIGVETCLNLKPEVLMLSGMNASDPNVERIAAAGIVVLYNNEWMESSLLGRAEWIKFMGALYGKEALADSLFDEVEAGYLSLRERAAAKQERPELMTGSDFRGTWYVPPGNSFMAELFADAGANYCFASEQASGSIPLTVESALLHFAKAEVWLNCNFDSREELLAANSHYALFTPFKEGKIYNFNRRRLPSGANDFWEGAVLRPDLLLADVIAILHPELIPQHRFTYAAPLR